MKYKLLHNIYIDKLEKDINDLLEQGWKLHGHTLIETYGGKVYYQAMIKEDNSDETMLSENKKVSYVVSEF